MAKILALNLTAGGIKGLTQATILRDLSKGFFEKTGKILPIDYLAGVSIGALNATMIVEEKLASKNFYGDKAIEVFHQLDDKDFNFLTKNNLTSLTFAESPIKILTLSTSLTGLTPTIWTNFGTQEAREAKNYLIKEIDKIPLQEAVKASAAMPTIVKARDCFYDGKVSYEIDGAITSKSAVLPLLSNLVSLENIQPKDLVILSLGCGQKIKQKDFSALHDAGTLSYGMRMKALIASSFDSREALDEEIAANLLESLGGSFLSFNPFLSDEIFFNHYDTSAAHITKLDDYNQELLQSNSTELNHLLDQLVELFS
jgi:hypothetical protein